jgi:hypothetical protein
MSIQWAAIGFRIWFYRVSLVMWPVVLLRLHYNAMSVLLPSKSLPIIIQGVSGGIVNILGGGSTDYFE